MGVNEIKQEIGRYERSIELRQQALDKLRNQITEETKPFVKIQLKSEVESRVKHNPEHTKELGRDTLSAMKQRLFTLLDSSDNLVDTTFSDDSLWVHVNYNSDGSRYAYDNQKLAKEKIHKGIKMIIGEAGKILLDNGYIKVGHEYRWDDDFYRSYNFKNDSKAKTKLLYGFGLSVPPNIQALIEKYVEEIKALHEASIKVSDLQKALSEQEAVDLWDEV